jgi:hypothetical protein
MVRHPPRLTNREALLVYDTAHICLHSVLVDQHLRSPDSVRWVVRYLAGQREHFIHQRFVWDHPINKSPGERLVRFYDSPRQREKQGIPEPRHLREVSRTPALRRNPNFDEARREPCAIRRDPNIASEGHREPNANRRPIDRCDHWLAPRERYRHLWAALSRNHRRGR